MEKVSQEQINEWKAKYGEIVKITVKDEVNGDKCCYLHKPTRKTLSYASVAGKNDALKFNEIVLRDCWLAGDEEIKTDDTLFISASAKLADLIDVKEAELEKL